MLDYIGDRYMMVFKDEVALDLFSRIDASQLRARFLSSAIPLYADCDSAVPTDMGEGVVVDKPYQCYALMPDGSRCEACFATKKARGLHILRTRGGTHGSISYLDMLTVTNQCFFCCSAFCSRQIAQQHVKRSVLHGRCWADRSWSDPLVVEPTWLECPACDFVATDLAGLQRHIRTHCYSLWPSHILLNDGRPDSSASLDRTTERWQHDPPPWLVKRRERTSVKGGKGFEQQGVRWGHEKRRGRGKGKAKGRPKSRGRR